MTSRYCRRGLSVTALTLFFVAGLAAAALALTDLELLGKHLFFDTNLSTPPGMSCASCHAPEVGWTGPNSEINAAGAVMPGVIHTRAGNRKPPSASYAGFSPRLHFDGEKFLGGMFWDGRATGWELGDPLQEQALGPFLNPVEMKNPNERKVLIEILLKSNYADLFQKVYVAETGKNITPNTLDLTSLYQLVGKAIAAYERSSEVNPFDSKFDKFREEQGGDVSNFGIEVDPVTGFRKYVGPPKNFQSAYFSLEEAKGLALFNADSYTQQGLPKPPGAIDGGMCYACHPTQNHVVAANDPNNPPVAAGTYPPLFTDHSYDNLGIPKNPENPFYSQPRKINPEGKAWIDLGLGGFLESTPQHAVQASDNYGKHKVPTLRNVAKRLKWSGTGWVDNPEFVKAYGHNGFFKSNFADFPTVSPLQQILHFYNTRDVPGQGWPPPMPLRVPWAAPEVAENLNQDEVGNLGFAQGSGMPILRFLETLSDSSTPLPPSP